MTEKFILESETEEKLTEENEAGIRQLYYKVWERRLAESCRSLEKAGFKPILIKGWAAAIFYPDPAERIFVDIDMMFDASEFKEAGVFLAKEHPGVLIDLHKGARHLDELAFDDLYKNSIQKPCGDEQTLIRVPCDEDHLRILCVHWLNDGGADRKRLLDIYYAIQNRSANFDWERCFSVVSPKRRKWVVSAIVLANKYLDLPLDTVPLGEKDKLLPAWLTRTLEDEWESGVRLTPMHTVLTDKKRFWEQLSKRLLPNPIQATIETGGAFDNTPRLFYQLADILKRSYPSIKRISRAYWQQFKYR